MLTAFAVAALLALPGMLFGSAASRTLFAATTASRPPLGPFRPTLHLEPFASQRLIVQGPVFESGRRDSLAGLCALAALGAAAAVRGRCVAAAVSEVDEVALGSATASARMAALAVSGEQMDVAALPGDPSLVLHTNVAIADKPALLKAASEAIAASLSKPESYVAVCINDSLDLVFGGTDAPCAVGCVYSIGSINQQNNASLTAAISALLEPHGVAANRIYLNFFDVPRENCGWSGRTFAG
jgi:phenylpyruvate tautomerase